MKSRPGLIVSSLVIANFLGQLMQTMLNTALPRMMLDLGINEGRAQWLITVYYLTAGITVPVAGFLIGRFTTRGLFFTSASAFAAGTLIAGISPDFILILGGRIIQGMGAGLLMPLFQTTILRVFPKGKIGSAMGLIGLVMGLAPALGPTLSGLVVQDHSWRILFYALLPIVIANLLLAAFSLQNVGERHREKLDYISILLSTTGFAGLLYGVNLAGDQSAPRVWAGAVILSGILFIILFIRRQLKLTVPLLDFRLFKSRSFSLASIIGVLMFIVMVGAELLIPLYVQNVRGLTPRESGLMLLPGALLLGCTSVISGKIYDRYGVKIVLRGGFTLIAGVSLLISLMLSQDSSILILAVLYVFLMVGIGFIMTPVTAYAMASVSPRMIAHASPMTISIRSLASSMGGVLLIAIMTITMNYSSFTFPVNMMQGFHAAFWSLTVVAIAGLGLSFNLKGRTHS
ncbi:DHA2 family efflux MFS transporter permease subunit [Paenibacillus sp. LMG 31459]|uniref:DHA2 family efflux MFS transporter permease subunit n=1 Tax=Paenibacillus phytohabitans TaxID=2654978 RepID=A0ABX1YMV0_9BACL|nr:DHA2 family efflux MFS transporter permease subunit [Paenibacillus phytohabitans]NOU81869.1 DHA2 family efflux MFS transporter permease subunit [Paenibacillus phytohabitans]